jgi:hypothetical protein
MALFIWLIIRLIQLIFSAGTVFFSHKKSDNSIFQPAYNSSRTAPIYLPLFLKGKLFSDRSAGCKRRSRTTKNNVHGLGMMD